MSYPVLSIQKRQAYYDEWLSSGELQPQFLRRKNLSPSTFKADGIKRGQPMIGQRPLQTLLPVQIKPIETPPEPAGLWLQLSSGSRLHFTTEVPAQYVGSLLASMESGSPC
jgi:hypothetical protein